jgi:hypothetical protein
MDCVPKGFFASYIVVWAVLVIVFGVEWFWSWKKERAAQAAESD